jgi:hypothetical protein
MKVDEGKMSTPGFWAERDKQINEPTHATAADRRAYLLRIKNGRSMSDPRYAEIEAEEQALFLAEWTAEITAARRAEWNTWVKAQGSKIPATAANKKLATLGWTLNDLQRAVKSWEAK